MSPTFTQAFVVVCYTQTGLCVFFQHTNRSVRLQRLHRHLFLFIPLCIHTCLCVHVHTTDMILKVLGFLTSTKLFSTLTTSRRFLVTDKVCAHTHTHSHARVHSHTHTHAQTHANTHAHTRIYPLTASRHFLVPDKACTHPHTHTLARTHTRTHAHAHTHIHTHIHMHDFAPLHFHRQCMCIHTHVHTHTYTYKHARARA